MTIAVLCDENQKRELLARKAENTVQFIWADSVQSLLAIDAEVYFDLDFRTRISTKGLKQVEGRMVFVNAISEILPDLPPGFSRINAWPGFLERGVAEVVLNESVEKARCHDLFGRIGREMIVVPDQPGMVVPRILAAIINEAYFTLGDGVSSRSEIDTAMKLGTNYPKGPFEWCDAIGIDKIYRLLLELSAIDARYKPAPALSAEIENLIADGSYS